MNSQTYCIQFITIIILIVCTHYVFTLTVLGSLFWRSSTVKSPQYALFSGFQILPRIYTYSSLLARLFEFVPKTFLKPTIHLLQCVTATHGSG